MSNILASGQCSGHVFNCNIHFSQYLDDVLRQCLENFTLNILYAGMAMTNHRTSWAALVSNSLFNWSCKVLSDLSNFGWWVTMLGIMGDHPWEAGDNIWEGDFE